MPCCYGILGWKIPSHSSGAWRLKVPHGISLSPALCTWQRTMNRILHIIAFSLPKKKHPKLTTTRNRFRYSKYFSTMNYLQASDYTAQLFLCRCLIRAQIALLAKNQTATDTLLIEMMNILSETHAHTQTYIYIIKYTHIYIYIYTHTQSYTYQAKICLFGNHPKEPKDRHYETTHLRQAPMSGTSCAKSFRCKLTTRSIIFERILKPEIPTGPFFPLLQTQLVAAEHGAHSTGCQIAICCDGTLPQKLSARSHLISSL